MLVDLDGLLGRLLLLLLLSLLLGGGEGCGGSGIGLGDDGCGRIGSLGLGGVVVVGVVAVRLSLDGGSSGSGTTRDLGRAGGTRNGSVVGVVAGGSNDGSSVGNDLVGIVAGGDGLALGIARSSDCRGDAARLEGKSGRIHDDDGGSDE